MAYGVVRPQFEAGDLLFFDDLCLHRTATEPHMSRPTPRHRAVELRGVCLSRRSGTDRVVTDSAVGGAVDSNAEQAAGVVVELGVEGAVLGDPSP